MNGRVIHRHSFKEALLVDLWLLQTRLTATHQFRCLVSVHVILPSVNRRLIVK